MGVASIGLLYSHYERPWPPNASRYIGMTMGRLPFRDLQFTSVSRCARAGLGPFHEAPGMHPEPEIHQDYHDEAYADNRRTPALIVYSLHIAALADLVHSP